MDFDPNGFVVGCSATLYIYEITNKIHDLDIVVGSKIWNEIIKTNKPKTSIFGDEMICLYDREIELFNRLFSSQKTAEELIAQSVTIDGIKFIDLNTTREMYVRMNRPKDLEKIKLIDKYLINLGK